MSRPTFLYENALEGATLTPSSTATGYSVDSLKTRVTADRWTSTSDTTHSITAQLASALLPTAFAITAHSGLVSSGLAPAALDSFTRGDESPATTDWTKRSTGELNLVSNILTRDTEPSGVTTMYSHDTVCFDEDGYGYAEVKVRFDNTAAAGSSHAAGAVGRWNVSLNTYLCVLLKPSGVVTLASHSTSYDVGSAGTLVDETWYAVRIEVDATGVRGYVDDVELVSTGTTPFSTVAAAQYAGVRVENDDPAVCSTDFDDFSAGIISDADSPRGVVILRGGTDGSTWPYERVYYPQTIGTILIPFDDASSYEYWQWEFHLRSAGAITLGCLALGRRLDLTESMAQGFDPSAMRLLVHQSRSNAGSYLGSVVRYVTQTVRLRFGPAGLSTTDFFDVTGTPSWRDFLRTTWALGRAWWFGWDLGVWPNAAWLAMPSRKSATGAPFITAIRRGWTFMMDVLVEVVEPDP